MSFIAYKLFGGISKRWEKNLPSFKAVYESSGFEDPFFIYLAKVLTVSFLGAPVVFALTLPLHMDIMKLPPLRSFLASLVLSAFYMIISMALGLYFPVYVRYSRKERIDASLPYTISYMASIASAGIGVERLLEEAAEVEPVEAIKRELALILRDIKILGFDTATALARAAERSPSLNFNIFFSGLRDTFITSGDLREYLMFMARRMIEDKISTLRSLTSSLAVIGEVYVTAMVAAPLMLVVMMIIMAMLGGTVGGVPPLLIVYVLTFVLVPAAAIAILVMVDAILSKV